MDIEPDKKYTLEFKGYELDNLRKLINAAMYNRGFLYYIHWGFERVSEEKIKKQLEFTFKSIERQVERLKEKQNGN